MRLKSITFSVVFFIILGCSFPQWALRNITYIVEQPKEQEIISPEYVSPYPTSGLIANSQARLASVKQWLYYLDSNPGDRIIQKITNSSYDMVVIDPIVTESGNEDFPIADVVSSWHDAAHPKLVIAYIDIAEAEDWRTYWQTGWGIGNPEWIIAQDPDGWEGDYPVAYWQEDWQQIWLGDNGYLELILESGFDGIYLDWVEAYSDENVIHAATVQNLDPRQEMIRWIGSLVTLARERQPDFIVIAQNAAELVEYEDYLLLIDAISQEQIWFDGGVDNHPPGDCPLPRTEAEVDTDAYMASLPPLCREYYQDNPEGTLHTSSQEYLHYLTLAQNKSKIIFTVDYAQKPENIAWVYQTSRSYGFIPFVGERTLSIYLEPVP